MSWHYHVSLGHGDSCQSNPCHPITMTSYWARWRLKSPASRLFTQALIEARIKENIKAPRHWPLCGEFTGDPVNLMTSLCTIEASIRVFHAYFHHRLHKDGLICEKKEIHLWTSWGCSLRWPWHCPESTRAVAEYDKVGYCHMTIPTYVRRWCMINLGTNSIQIYFWHTKYFVRSISHVYTLLKICWSKGTWQ